MIHPRATPRPVTRGAPSGIRVHEPEAALQDRHELEAKLCRQPVDLALILVDEIGAGLGVLARR